ncbi:MAG: N-6 DNA methylase [Phycisphaerae bacterium]|nr:N-6 DNA methylase [Phycisphaerae bacterium]
MPEPAITATALKPYLESCGYTGSRLAEKYRFDKQSVPLAGFVGKPWDTRSACIAVVDAQPNSKTAAEKCVRLGAPTVLVCNHTGIDWWKISPNGPSQSRPIKAADLANFFKEHRDDLAPEAICAAKLRHPTRSAQQMWFVDIGLMPAVERRAGEMLNRLVTGALKELAAELSGKLKTHKHFEDVYKTAFWLLAAKILHDKGVNKFKRIDLCDVDEVFARVGKHYAVTEDLPPGGGVWRPAIDATAKTIAGWGYLGNLSTESLAYLYETALIDKKPREKGRKAKGKTPNIRKELGIHSTPSVLVDHMLAQLWPLIEQIKPQDRRVFELACGHAGFLTAAMRWLRQWSGIEEGAEQHRYLRDRVFGLEYDPFAIEIAKLSLTLADVPHGNSWKIDQGDMFEPGRLAKTATGCTILLANPPFERFSQSDKQRYSKLGEPVVAQTKAVEMLMRTIPHLAPGAVFGVVVPQGVLHNTESKTVRRFLVEECELTEISLFADNLFEHSRHETAILLGRRKTKKRITSELRYRHVRKRGMEAFKGRMAFTSERRMEQNRLVVPPGYDLRVPELEEVWDYLDENPTLMSFAGVGQGLVYRGQDLPKGAWTTRPYEQGLGVPGFSKVPSDLEVFGLPKRVSMNLDPAVIRRLGTGTTTGLAQVLVNYAPVSREGWRLKGVLDNKGHAVTSRYLTVRPKGGLIPPILLWAIVNSPVANAFAYCHLGKRDILVGTMRRLPIPPAFEQSQKNVVVAARAYLAVASQLDGVMQARPEEKTVREALLRMDAEVLKLYDLPPRLERQLLDLFQGVERKGVGCDFRGYYPEGLDAYVPLHELISEEYQRSTLDAFVERHQPAKSPEVLTALRTAAEAYAEE